LIGLILLSAAFLGGYWCGRQPGSPDVFAWLQRTLPQVAEAGERIVVEFRHAQSPDAAGRDPNAAFAPLRGPESIGSAEQYVENEVRSQVRRSVQR
jgi:hypothetical protein